MCCRVVLGGETTRLTDPIGCPRCGSSNVFSTEQGHNIQCKSCGYWLPRRQWIEGIRVKQNAKLLQDVNKCLITKKRIEINWSGVLGIVVGFIVGILIMQKFLER